MPRIVVDGVEHEVAEGRNLLEVGLELGLDLPYFCWHPALGSVGACRQCAVKQYRDADDEQGKIVMACMTPAADGTRISVEDDEARAMRAHVVEWLMANHPHDCPVCDEGGECHLQDMTVMTGHRDRRFRFDKRTYRNQDLGPFLRHEMNRCIQCYRCVRFYDDFAGGHDLQAFAAHDHVYFGRHEDGPLESVFSGNLVEVCPTGVFTDRILAGHYTRKWDLTTAPSVCPHCSLGCNTTPGAREQRLRRVRNRYHHEVNGYFLCDRGRYGHAFTESERRLGAAFVPDGGAEGAAPDDGPRALSPDEAIARFEELAGDATTVVGIGSARASLEDNFALREFVGSINFSDGLDADAHVTAHRLRDLLDGGPVHAASLEDVRRSDAAIVLGHDPSDTAPVLALALRECAHNAPSREAVGTGIPAWHDAAVREFVQDRSGPFYTFTAQAGPLDEIARTSVHGPPEEQLRWATALLAALHDDEDAVAKQTEGLPKIDGRAAEDLVRGMAERLREAERAVVVVDGAAGDGRLLLVAAALARALSRAVDDARDDSGSGDAGNGRQNANAPAGLVVVPEESNAVGQAVLDGGPLDPVLDLMESGEIDLVIVLENDLFRRAPRERVQRALRATRVVVIDHLATETARHAHLVLPSTDVFESAGSFVNFEGRVQRFVPVVETGEAAPGARVGAAGASVRAAWRWLSALAMATGRDACTWPTLDALRRDLGRVRPGLEAPSTVDPAVASDLLARLHEQNGHGSGRAGGRDAADAALAAGLPSLRVPRQLPRFSGRTALHADLSMREPRPPHDPDSVHVFSMEGYAPTDVTVVPSEVWTPGWNSVQALNRFQEEIGGPLRGGDPGRRLFTIGPREPSLDPGPLEGFAPRDDALRLLRRPAAFGDEELSSHAAAIAERTAVPTLWLHPEDAEGAALEEGVPLPLELGDENVEVRVALDPSLRVGTAALGPRNDALPAPSTWPRWIVRPANAGGPR